MNKGFGVRVTVARSGEQEPKVAPVLVVARDEQDAEIVAAQAAGAGAQAEALRELSDEEVMEHGLDLQAHGSVKSLSILSL
jgi:hypothetical protein